MKKNKGRKFEDECQKTINSGAFFQKGDLKTSDYVIEAKFTEKKGFRISTKILDKIWNDALDAQKLPLLIIGIKDGTVQYNLTVQINKETKP
jgi:hypothetical protein